MFFICQNMLCLKSGACGHEIMQASSHGLLLSRSIQRIMHKLGRGAGNTAQSCSGAEDGESNYAVKGRSKNMCWYRIQLEQEVEGLQKQLQQELDLNVALANALHNNLDRFTSNLSTLPDKAQELLENISELEDRVSKLEEELISLNLRLRHEQNGRQVAASNETPTTSTDVSWEEHITYLRVSKLGTDDSPETAKQDLSTGSKDSDSCSLSSFPERFGDEELAELCCRSGEGEEVNASTELSKLQESEKRLRENNLWLYPNRLSQEMVRCMRDIYICLSESSNIPTKVCSHSTPFRSSPVGPLSTASFASYSDSSVMPSTRSNSTGIHQSDEFLSNVLPSDPYGVNNTTYWGSIGNYGLASEVSWMSVGKEQLEYAAEALKKFKLLVEQLGKVDPAELSGDERLAFWINIYNALIMHAYLAYGVPKSDIKLFSLMQKASYKIGEQSLSAAEIEFVILKMKPPAHRPQLALVLALHKLRDSELHRRYSIDSPQPLAIFALSCGMYSSPAVRIYTADNVQNQLRNTMKDYIQASIGINEKGKLVVPNLLHFFAKSVVEDSLLVDWICRYLSPDQVTVVRDSTSQRKQRLLGVRSFSIVPFDTRFRYLFLPDCELTS